MTTAPEKPARKTAAAPKSSATRKPARAKAAKPVMQAPALPVVRSTDPIFVLAAPRSYSSLVNAMIGQHPELYGVPELNLFQCETVAEFNSGKNAAGAAKSPFWKAMRQLKHIIAAHLSAKNNTQALAKQALSGALNCELDWVGIAEQENGFGWRSL